LLKSAWHRDLLQFKLRKTGDMQCLGPESNIHKSFELCGLKKSFQEFYFKKVLIFKLHHIVENDAAS
jgi:hypothetical protein